MRILQSQLSKAEDIVDEHEHVKALFISKVHPTVNAESATRAGHPVVRSSALYQGNLRVLSILFVNNVGFDHFVIQVVSFTGSLTNASENGQTTASLSDVIDKLHDENCFTNTGATKKTNLATSSIRSKQVYNLNARLKGLDG